jgi:2-iminobutanoate/2-iminopropanoate deaminase
MRATTEDTTSEARTGSLLRRRRRGGGFTAGTYTAGFAIGKPGGERYRRTMTIETVETSNAPSAIGPYSQAVVASAGRLVFCSGQIPLDPKSGELVGGGDVRKETHQVMLNLEAVLQAAGASLGAVLKTTIYLVDMAAFPAVNEVYASYFSAPPPARATVQVAGLPRGSQVEIDAIAAVG